MNLMGEVGTSALMDGSNLRNILETMHGENALLHNYTQCTGKDFQRPLRGLLTAG